MELLTEEDAACRNIEMQSFLLSVGYADTGAAAGMVQYLNRKQSRSFTGLDQAFLQINRWMDEREQASALRAFHTGNGVQSYEEAGDDGDIQDSAMSRPGIGMPEETGLRKKPGMGRRGAARRKEAFLVRIICRQHASWQGEVCWKSQRLYFRSTLELMSLIHSALKPLVGCAAEHSA